jgi:hypothetical protein
MHSKHLLGSTTNISAMMTKHSQQASNASLYGETAAVGDTSQSDMCLLGDNSCCVIMNEANISTTTFGCDI